MKKQRKFLLMASIIFSANVLAADLTVKNIEIKNLNQLPKEYVLKNLPIAVGSKYTDEQVKDIEAALKQTGLVDGVKVSKAVNGDDVNLVIEVQENKAAIDKMPGIQAETQVSQRTDLKITSVKVNGAKTIDLSPILNQSNLKVGDYLDLSDVDRLASQIFETGYYQSVKPQINRNSKDKTVDIVMDVVENPVIKSVDIKGVTLFDINELKKASGLVEGQILNLHSINPEASPLIAAYQQKGVITARIERLNVSPEGDVYVELTEGIVNNIEYKKLVQKQDNNRLSEQKSKLKTKQYILERMTYVKKGEILTEADVNATLQEFFRTGLFTSVEPVITADETNPNLRNITFVVDERPTTTINGQVAYESKEGLTGGITFSDKNFLGYNQDLSTSVNFGTRGNYEFNFSFFDPWVKNTNRLQLGTNLFFKREKAKKSDLTAEGKNGVPASVENPFRVSGSYIYGGSVTVGKGITRDTFITLKPRIYGARSENNEDPKKVFVDYTLGSVTLTGTYDTRDDSYIPKKGIYASASYELGYIFREKSLTPEGIAGVKKYVDSTYKNDLQKLNNDLKAIEKDKNKGVNSPEYKAKKKELEDKEKVLKKDEKASLASVKETLKPRAYQILSADLRAYHPVFKDKNSMAYRITLGYATKGTPENMLFRTSDGTTLRGYEDETTNALVTGTVENRTYINDYVQLVAFAEAGVNAKRLEGQYENGLAKYQAVNKMFTKENLKADIGVGARLTTPIGVIRLDYAFPLVNTESRKGKISFGFGQTF